MERILAEGQISDFDDDIFSYIAILHMHLQGSRIIWQKDKL